MDFELYFYYFGASLCISLCVCHFIRQSEACDCDFVVGDGMYIFADAMEKNTTLTKIDLRHNSFSDRGVIKLVPVIIEKNNSLYSIQLEHNDNLHSMYIVNKLYDHVDRNNIGVFKREEERLQKERLKREELQLLQSAKMKASSRKK